ncbi:MAG: nitric oxide reductase large subunit, partial [Ramlibacter sp.]|nr:nitric oxide reductase large subunit [Ramlibacter sp.]
MTPAAQPLTTDAGPLSPWWMRAVVAVMLLGFAGLLAITALAYRNAPPVPGRVLDSRGEVLFTGDEVREGQAVFLKYGLMANGSIWGHGAYLGPDYAAATLHSMGEHAADAVARERYGKPFAQLPAGQQAGATGEAAALLKGNRYDPAADALQFSAGETAAWREQPARWKRYFQETSSNGRLKPQLITDAEELRQFSAFVTWAAWASVANRPGENHSYTNNFPYDPTVGNVATSG